MACNEKKETQETFTTGTTELLVEESVLPLTEDLINVFQSHYDNSNFDVKVNNESQLMNLLFKDSVRLAVIPRELTDKEKEFFKNRVQPIIVPIAKEAIVFIGNKNNNDSLIKYNDFLNELKNPNSQKLFILDNVNSSLVNKIKRDLNGEIVSKNVFYLNETKEVIEYISKTNNAVGVVGSNWLAQPDQKTIENKNHLKTFSIFNENSKNFVKPSQSTIADNTYPLTRTINIIDIKGNSGLGKGFSSFAAGNIGQRLVLKSGLMPISTPPREVIIKE